MSTEQSQQREALLEGAINQAWDAYYSQVEKLFSRARGRGLSAHGHKYQKAFTQIAELCLAADVPVRDYVTTSFEMVMKARRTILPRDLLAPALMDRYRALAQQSGGGLAATGWKVQQLTLLQLRTRAPEKFPTDEAALLLIQQPFDSSFRVLYPEPFNETLFRYYGELAWEELRGDPSLRDFLRKTKPQNLLELQRRIAYFSDTGKR